MDEKLTSEPIREQSPSPEELLMAFRAEIRQISQDEYGDKRHSHNLNEIYFDPDQLTMEDMILWDKIKDKSIAREDLSAHKAKLDALPESPTRDLFLRFLDNKAAPIFGRREMEEDRKKKEQA